MKIKLNKILFGFLFFVGAVVSGQIPPPPPPQEESGTPGAPKNVPVDMYVVLLAIVAMVFIIYYVKQYNKKIA